MSQDVFKVYLIQQKPNKHIRKPSSTAVDETLEELSFRTINESKKQLDEMIEQLDEKIKKRIEINESNFLLAYKMHLAKISKQLKHLKDQSESDDRILTADNAISNLVKQSSFFRQEAIRLQSLLQDAFDELEVYKRKSELLQKDLQKSNDTIKRLTLENKKFEVSNITLTQQLKAQTIFSRETEEVLLQAKGKVNQLKKQLSLNQEFLSKIPTENIRSYSKQKQQGKGSEKLSPDCKIISIESLKSNFQDQTNSPKKSFRSNRSEKGNRNQNQSKFSHDLLLIKKHPQTSQKLKDGQKKRYRTQSTFDYRNKNNFSNNNIHFDIGQTCEEKVKKSCGTNEQIRNQLHIFKGLMIYLNKARQSANILSDNSEIHSLTINQFIFHDKDILQFCSCLFPNLEIKQKVNQFGKSFQAEAKEKSKTLAHLSAELMKKFKIKNQRFQTQQSNISNSNLLEETNPHLSPTQKYKILLGNGVTTHRDKILQKRKDTKEVNKNIKKEPQNPCQRTWNSFYLTTKKDQIFVQN